MLAVDANHTFHVKHVSRTIGSNRSCYRFTGFGDRPCEQEDVPVWYGLLPSWFWWLFHWNWSRVDAHNPLVYTDAIVPVQLLDFSWVEVVRYSSHVTGVGTDGGNYGVWHFLAIGSGVSVNIGRAIRFDNKHKARLWSQLDSTAGTLPCQEFAHSCADYKDVYFCVAARKNGYDSVITRDLSSMHTSLTDHQIIEVVICLRDDTREQEYACADSVEYRLGDGIHECTCNSSREILGCVENNTNMTMSLVSYGTHPLYLLQFCILFCMLAVGIIRYTRRPSQRRVYTNFKSHRNHMAQMVQLSKHHILGRDKISHDV